MIIVDFSHLSYRNLFTAIYSAKPKKDKNTNKYITDDWFPMYVHQMLFSLSKIEKKFDGYGQVVLAIDSKMNWRKKYLEKIGYKGSRKKIREESDVDFNEFFKRNEEFLTFLKDGLGYIVIEVDYVEADDIGYVLSDYFKEPTILVTEDKDWMQHMIDNLNVHLYKPVKDEYIQNSEDIQDTLKKFRATHILIGDKADDIPNVMVDVQFSPEFTSFLKERHIENTLPSIVENLDVFDELVSQAKEKGIKIYKPIKFGEKTAIKFIKEPKEFINKKIKDKKKLYDNIRRNRILVDIKKLPKQLKESIIKVYESNKGNRDTHSREILENFLDEMNLNQVRNLTLNGIDLSTIPDKAISSIMEDMFDF